MRQSKQISSQGKGKFLSTRRLGLATIGFLAVFVVAAICVQDYGTTHNSTHKQQETSNDIVNKTKIVPLDALKKPIKTILYVDHPKFTTDPLESPKAETSDELIESNEYVEPAFPDTPLGSQLQTHMNLIDGIGTNAETIYQESLKTLRKNPKESTELLMEAYHLMDEQRYFDRWKVVNTLGAMEREATLDALSQIVEVPMPENYPYQDMELNPYKEEGLIRVAAIRGIEQLARQGIEEAKSRLFDCIFVEDPYVRKMAVLAYRDLDNNPESEIENLKNILPHEDYPILDIQMVATPPATEFQNISESDETNFPEDRTSEKHEDYHDDLPPFIDDADYPS